jgi:hypothetical protein
MRKVQYTAEEWAAFRTMGETSEYQQWRYYLSNLASSRRNISTEQLYAMLKKQDFKCALSGVTMTCIRERYVKCWTNASLDRIVAGSDYRIENVHLVCMKVNLLKRKLTVDEFIRRCHEATRKRRATEWQVLVSEFNPEGNNDA